ncbi:MAG: tetratricopeptide repeat protein [Chitinispirillia bacterium]|nr:tetratricopeptide repeat protein [Chitinispirillia bacterium]
MAASDTTLEELKQRCEENPDDLGNVLDLIQRYSSLGWYNEALDFCRSMMKRHARAYSFLLEFANVLYKHSDFREAHTIFKKLTELKPERIESWNNLGILELSNGKREEAHSAFQKVLELEPNNAGALCNTGNYFAEKGDAGLAATYFERAIDARPDFAEAWYNLGNSYMSLSQFKEAAGAFEKAIRFDPRFGSAYKNLGFVREQLGDDGKALECYTKAASINRADPGIQANLSGLYMRLGQPDKALECGKHAAILAPAEPSSWSALRKAAIAVGDGVAYSRAVTALISSIGDKELATAIADLRDMGFGCEAEELVRYSVKINRAGESVDALPFAESRAPKIEGAAEKQQIFKVINNKKGKANGKH